MSWSNIISFIGNLMSSWSNIISNNIVGFIISLLFFVIQYLLGLYNPKKLSYYIGNNDIKSISTTDIIVWNNGRETLYYDSTYSGRHTPKIKGNNILNSNTIRVNSSVEDIKFIQNEDNLVLDFNKMEPRDCFIAHIQHTEHDNNNIQIDFELNDFKIKKYNSLKKIKYCNNIPYYITIILALILFLKFHLGALIDNKHMITTLDTMIGPFFVTVFPLYIIVYSILRIIYLWKNPMPDKLKQYLSDKLK